MKVVATKVGHDGVKVRHPGDEFEMPEGSKGSWFVVVPAAEPEPVAKATRGRKAAEAPPVDTDVA